MLEHRWIPGLLIVIAGCGGSDSATGSGSGTVEIATTGLLTDDFHDVAVYVSVAALLQASGAETPVLATKGTFDVFLLQGASPVVLASTNVPARIYSGLRVVIDSARIALKPGKTFADGTTSAKLLPPATAAQGIEVPFREGVTIPSDTTTTLVLYLDGVRSFALIGPAAAPTGVDFNPVLLAADPTVTASISGVVSPGGSRARVFAIRGADTVQSAVADPATGAYTLRYLPAATYIVSARAAGFQVAMTLPLPVVRATTVTGINLALPPLP